LTVDARDRTARYYNIHDKLCICVQGCQNAIADVIDTEFHNFRVENGKSDLTIVLGDVPSDSWVPHGTAIGEDIVYDDRSGEVSVQYNSKPAYYRENFQLIIRGDIRRTGSVTIHVPSLKMRLPYWLRTGMLFLLNNFLSDDEILADHLLTCFVEPLLYYRLPDHGCSLVHAAGVSNGRGIIFYGSSNVGKTSMILEMMNRDYEFFGDDLVVLDENGHLLSYPKTIKLEARHLMAYPAFRHKIGVNMSLARRFLFNRFVRNSAEKPFEMMFHHPAVSEIFDDAKVGDSCTLDGVVYLRRGTSTDYSLEELDIESCVKTLARNLFWEFDMLPHRHNQYTRCMPYFSEDFLEHEMEHHSKVTGIISKAISGTRAFELQLPTRFSPREAYAAMDKLLLKI
jgi:hypothetical protein